jgi:hypothetical protein
LSPYLATRRRRCGRPAAGQSRSRLSTEAVPHLGRLRLPRVLPSPARTDGPWKGGCGSRALPLLFLYVQRSAGDKGAGASPAATGLDPGEEECTKQEIQDSIDPGSTSAALWISFPSGPDLERAEEPSSKSSAESDGLRSSARPRMTRTPNRHRHCIFTRVRPQNQSCRRVEPTGGDEGTARWAPSVSRREARAARRSGAGCAGNSRPVPRRTSHGRSQQAGSRTMAPRLTVRRAAGLSASVDAAAARDPSALRDWIGRPRSSALPSDSRSEGPTSPDTPQETCCTASADGA